MAVGVIVVTTVDVFGDFVVQSTALTVGRGATFGFFLTVLPNCHKSIQARVL